MFKDSSKIVILSEGHKSYCDFFHLLQDAFEKYIYAFLVKNTGDKNLVKNIFSYYIHRLKLVNIYFEHF